MGRPGTFIKGQTGNANGRPKISEEFRTRARNAVNDHVISAWINEVEILGKEWVRCSELLAAYGYGKPTQGVELSGPDGSPLRIVRADEMSDDQLAAVVTSDKQK